MKSQVPYVMSNEQISQYIDGILKSQDLASEDVGELNIKIEFKAAMVKLQTLSEEAKKIRARTLELEKEMAQREGAVNSLSTMLIRLEDARRKASQAAETAAPDEPAAVVIKKKKPKE